MKPTTRKLDELGRLVLPRELREELGWRMVRAFALNTPEAVFCLPQNTPAVPFAAAVKRLRRSAAKKYVEPVFGPFVNYSNNKERASA